uniref:Uncharacterized protein n=1 Tax=Pithovirus LCPAC001 TaxID=2506585 RepID=A0A481Z4G5_9VIRU|nr:MAG: hypothetical protein LCPAC001_00500 [Pithovirus LCPAC001]
MEFILSYDTPNNFLAASKTTFEKEVRYAISYSFSPSILTVQIPPFLITNRGFYLGQIYPLQFKIDGALQYLNFTNTDVNKIQYYTPSDEPTSKSISIQFLKNIEGTTFKYNQNDSLTEIVFFNHIPYSFLSPLTVSTQIIVGLKPPGIDDNIIFSVAECTSSLGCNACGLNSCPEGFECVSAFDQDSLALIERDDVHTLLTDFGSTNNFLALSKKCEFPIKTSQNFGIRYKSSTKLPRVLTYTKKDNLVTINFVLESNIFVSKGVDSDIHPVEKWVFVDLPKEQTKMVTGGHYPLFIFDGSNKKYLTKPETPILSFTSNNDIENTIVYTLSDDSNNSLTFSPNVIGDWRSFVFDSSDFEDLPISSALKIGLWQIPSPNNKKAVSKAPIGEDLFVGVVILLLLILIVWCVVYFFSKKK